MNSSSPTRKVEVSPNGWCWNIANNASEKQNQLKIIQTTYSKHNYTWWCPAAGAMSCLWLNSVALGCPPFCPTLLGGGAFFGDLTCQLRSYAAFVREGWCVPDNDSAWQRFSYLQRFVVSERAHGILMLNVVLWRVETTKKLDSTCIHVNCFHRFQRNYCFVDWGEGSSSKLTQHCSFVRLWIKDGHSVCTGTRRGKFRYMAETIGNSTCPLRSYPGNIVLRVLRWQYFSKREWRCQFLDLFNVLFSRGWGGWKQQKWFNISDSFMYSTSGCGREKRVINYVKMVVSARSFSLSTYQSLSFFCLNFVFVSDVSFTCQFTTLFPFLPFCVNFVRFVSNPSFHFNPVVSTRPCLLFSMFSLFVST